MRIRIHTFSLVVLTAIFLASSVSVDAATRTWVGGNGNNMSSPANWAEGVAPITGDDVVFPAAALFRTPKCDLTTATVLQSMTFQGGYTFSDGSCRTRSLSSVGDLVLGPFPWAAPWTVEERLVLSDGSMHATISLGGPLVGVAIGNGATARVNLSNSLPASSVVKDGTGDLYLTLVGEHLSSVTAAEGTMSVQGGIVDDIAVAGGYILTAELSGSTITATGQSSVIWARNYSVRRLEITDGAQFRILGCPNAFTTVEPPVLTGGNLISEPSAPNCPGTRDRLLISNTSNDPIVGEFIGFPEGQLITSGARRYRLTYRGGDGNDLQILAVPGVPFDFDADGRADLATVRPADGTWYIQDVAGTPARRWGVATDRLVPGDYDGDGVTDHAAYRPSEGAWYIRYSFDVYWYPIIFGSGDDVPVPADFDGDGRTDIAVFRPSTGGWWVKTTLNTYSHTTVQFGRTDDIPVPADYDGDGRADIAVFRPENATWYIRRSSGGDLIFPWGFATDKLVPADYDGDGKADVAVFRPSEGNWYMFLSSTQSPNIVNWGIATDHPVPADYDGDGRSDVAIFRPSDGNWWINQSTAGVIVQQFGASEDRPIPGAFIH